MVPITGDQFLLQDTRGIPGTREIRFLTREQACLVLGGMRQDSTAVEWAIQHGLWLESMGCSLPLATADPELIEKFESEMRRTKTGRDVAAHNLLPVLPSPVI